MIPRRTLTVAAAILVLVPSIALAQLPVVNSPVVVVYSTTPTNVSVIEITGQRFGPPDPGSSLKLSGSVGLTVAATDPEIKSWKDDRIVAQFARAVTGGSVKVKSSAGWSATSATMDYVYSYTWYGVPNNGNDPDPTLATNASPLAVAIDAQGRVWINQEFHSSFQVWEPSTSVVRSIALPHPPGPGPFASMLFFDHADRRCQAGEDIRVDVDGAIWLSEGGAPDYAGVYANHSRILRYDPQAQTFRVFNSPGDNNQVYGLAFDRTHPQPRIWFTSNSHDSEVYSDLGRVTTHVPAKLVSFNPASSVLYNAALDYSSQSKNLVCPANVVDDTDCYHEYPLPESYTSCCGFSIPGPTTTHAPSHLVVDAGGSVWHTAYSGGNEIGRLNPATGVFDFFPLPASIGASRAAGILQSGPWQIVLAPNGDIVFTEEFDSTVARLAVAMLGGGQCGVLDGNGNNPCISEKVLPDADLFGGGVHSVAFDTVGNAWYTEEGTDLPTRLTSVGFVTADWQTVVRFPPLGVFAGTSAFTGSGIAIAPGSGDVWFGDYYRQRLGRLHRQ